MLKVGITQRVDYIESIGETRDVLDQRWVELLENNGIILIPIPNKCSVQGCIEVVKLNGIIVSGGNDHASRLACETDCVDYCLKHQLPLLGVCHGMQFIGQFLGSHLVRIEEHVGNCHEVNIRDNRYEIPRGNFKVNSFHNFTLDRVPSEFSVLATDNTGHCEAMFHKNLPVVTFMWHPERPPFLNWFNHFIKNFYEKY